MTDFHTEASLDDRRWLREAIELSRACPPSGTAFSVGAIIVDADGGEIARGFSREADPHDHAEESALRKISADDPRLPTATLYSSLEPCSVRMSRAVSCTKLILAARIRRVVFAWREPVVFVDGQGVELLHAVEVEAIEVPDLAQLVREINGHLVGSLSESNE